MRVKHRLTRRPVDRRLPGSGLYVVSRKYVVVGECMNACDESCVSKANSKPFQWTATTESTPDKTRQGASPSTQPPHK